METKFESVFKCREYRAGTNVTPSWSSGSGLTSCFPLFIYLFGQIWSCHLTQFTIQDGLSWVQSMCLYVESGRSLTGCTGFLPQSKKCPWPLTLVEERGPLCLVIALTGKWSVRMATEAPSRASPSLYSLRPSSQKKRQELRGHHVTKPPRLQGSRWSGGPSAAGPGGSAQNVEKFWGALCFSLQHDYDFGWDPSPWQNSYRSGLKATKPAVTPHDSE